MISEETTKALIAKLQNPETRLTTFSSIWKPFEEKSSIETILFRASRGAEYRIIEDVKL